MTDTAQKVLRTETIVEIPSATLKTHNNCPLELTLFVSRETPEQDAKELVEQLLAVYRS